ncbi:MAG: hypothetical protein AB1585_01625, partial [Thermodesulfobacteriota bacterium]
AAEEPVLEEREAAEEEVVLEALSLEGPGLEEKAETAEIEAFPEPEIEEEPLPETLPVKEPPLVTEKEKSVAKAEKDHAEKISEARVEKEEEPYLLPNIEITSVEGFTRQGELVDIVVEGISSGCKSIFLRVQNEHIKYFKNVYPSSGRFSVSFEDIIKNIQLGNLDQISVTAISLANSDISDTWKGKLPCRGKEDEAGGVTDEDLEQERGIATEKNLPGPMLSEESAEGEEEEEDLSIDEISGEEEEREGLPEALSFPNIEITEVKGITQKGELVDIVIEGTSVGCKSVFLKIQSENMKYFKNIYPTSRKFRESFEDILRKNKVNLAERISVTAISLANSDIFDTWSGKLEYVEKKRGRRKKTKEGKK